MTEELPVNGETARKKLSPYGDSARPMSRTMYSAILGSMGLSNSRLVFVSQITKWLKSHPEFRQTHYHEKLKLKVGMTLSVKAGRHRGEFIVEEIGEDGSPKLLRAA